MDHIENREERVEESVYRLGRNNDLLQEEIVDLTQTIATILQTIYDGHGENLSYGLDSPEEVRKTFEAIVELCEGDE